MSTLIRTAEYGHVFRSDDGKVPHQIDADEHTLVECERCWRSICIHDPHKGIFSLFTEICKDYEIELPGMEIPIVPPPEW